MRDPLLPFVAHRLPSSNHYKAVKAQPSNEEFVWHPPVMKPHGTPQRGLPLQRVVLPPLLLLLLGWFCALQPHRVVAQWSYSGPAEGCTDVLDVYTGGIRANTTSGSTGGFTVSNISAFVLSGPDCFIRGDFTIIFDIAAMRAATTAASAALVLTGTIITNPFPNVSIAIGGGVHFEGLLDDANITSDTRPLRLPTLDFLFARNASDPFDPDALPVDVALGGRPAAGVTWAVRDVAVATSAKALTFWHLVTLRNGYHLPRNSRIAVTNAAVIIERSSLKFAVFGRSGIALVFVADSIALLGDSQFIVNDTIITVSQTEIVTTVVMMSLIQFGFLLLHDASQLGVLNSGVYATNVTRRQHPFFPSDVTLNIIHGSSVMLHAVAAVTLTNVTTTVVNMYVTTAVSIWTMNQHTLYDSAQLSFSGVMTRVGNSSAIASVGIMLFNNIITLYNTSKITLHRCSISATNVTTSHPFQLVLVTTTSNTLILLNHSRFEVTSSAMRVVNCIAFSQLTVALFYTRWGANPFRLHDAAQLALINSSVSVFDVGVYSGHVAAGGLVVVTDQRVRMFVAGDARIWLDGVAVSLEGVTTTPGIVSWQQAVVFGQVEDPQIWHGDEILDLDDRGEVLITRCSAFVAQSTLGDLNTDKQPLAAVFSFPITVFRNSSTVRLCGNSTATIRNVTVAGTFFPGPYTETRGAAVWTANGRTTIVDACNASTRKAADRCGLEIGTHRCDEAVVATTNASNSSSNSGNSSNSHNGGAAPESADSTQNVGWIAGGVVLAVAIGSAAVAVSCWIRRRKERGFRSSPPSSGVDVPLNQL